ncbi:transcriptional regulator, Crp/Fnr family [Aquitalea magnusonii]|uniref:Transcriptional regulator, Crp/Fnr family n=1 Tax=Aquitalea magnusonii TaxID=332411 RepID=A0A3G9GCW4_9NEIS|nr:Crp/Fnr family transcriptional regulator [Aquitalea magnusonii]BBF85285.1 transcriptional regulator, Crp/Fnr family [Aquitalea magnusonii]
MSQSSGSASLPASLSNSSWFQSLPADLQHWLQQHARLLVLPAGQRLFARGDAADGLYGLAEGLVRISGSDASGQEAIAAVLAPPQWFGEIALFDAASRTHDAWTDSTVTLVHVPQAPLLALLAAQPQYWRDLGRLLSQKVRASFIAMEDLMLLPPGPRLARRLLQMSNSYGALQGSTLRELPLSQTRLAAMLALSRQTVNQQLQVMAAAGLLRLRRGVVEIVDQPGLQLLAAQAREDVGYQAAIDK